MNWSIVNMKSFQRYRLRRFGLVRPFLTHHCPKYTTLNWVPLTVRRHIRWLYFTFKWMNFNYLSYLKQYLVHFTSNYQVRHSAQLYFAISHANKIKLCSLVLFWFFDCCCLMSFKLVYTHLHHKGFILIRKFWEVLTSSDAPINWVLPAGRVMKPNFCDIKEECVSYGLGETIPGWWCVSGVFADSLCFFILPLIISDLFKH